jgi:hypothetical protein
MNTQNTPKITANNSKSKKPFFKKKEITFKSQEQLKAYLTDSVVKNKRRSFNMNVKLT